MSTSRRFINESAIYLLGNLATRAVSFALMPFYTRLLSPEELGAVAFGNTVGALASLILGFGAHSALSRYLPTAQEDQQKQWLGTSLTAVGVGPLVLLAVVAGGLSVLGKSSIGSLPVWPDLWLVLLGAWASVLPGMATQWFVSTHRPSGAALLSVVSVTLQVGLSVFAVLGLGAGVTGVFAAYAVAQVVLAGLSVGWLALSPGLKWQPALLRPLLLFAAPVVVHLFANWVLSISDRLLLERFAGEGVLAVYAVAYLFNLALTTMTSALAQALGPMFVRAAAAGDRAHEIVRIGQWFMAITLSASVVLAWIAPELLHFVAPRREYAAALPLLPWLIAGGAFQGFYFLMSQGSWYAGSTQKIALLTSVAALLNLGLNLWWIPQYGALGAAWSTAASYALLALLHDRAAQRQHEMAWPYRVWGVGVLVAALLIWLAQTRSALAGH